MKKQKEYTATDLRRMGVSDSKIRDLFYRAASNPKAYYTTITITRKVKVIDQETFDKRVKPWLKKHKNLEL